MWGVTAWRAFPFERGAFFTVKSDSVDRGLLASFQLVSLILTYSILLLKFRNEGKVPNVIAQAIVNSTATTAANQEL
jgi:hypothetical protein